MTDLLASLPSFSINSSRKRKLSTTLVVAAVSCIVSPGCALLLHNYACQQQTSKRGQSLTRRMTLLSDQVPESSTTDNTVVHYSPNAPLSLQDDYSSNDIINSDEQITTTTSSNNDVNEYSFFDEAVIYVRAGSGGQGANTFQIAAKNQNGQPDGGNGGQGGSVILKVDTSLNTLAGLTPLAWRPNSFGGNKSAQTAATSSSIKSFRAENGMDGGRGNKNGKYGKDVYIRVPPGTRVQEQIEKNDDTNSTTLLLYKDLGVVDNDNTELLVAKGGLGGEGTAVLQNTRRGVKRPRQPSTGGDRKCLKLTLQIVADVALVGVPNAGKSTLLAAVTRAKPKIANYPFTTVVPNLGVWVPPTLSYYSDNNNNNNNDGAGSTGLVLCDVPGLIAGASQGIGLGLHFLRHVERCHVILHLIDATSHDPIKDYEMLNRELCHYATGQLANMPQVVVVNKVDSLDGNAEDWEKGLRTKWTRQELEAKLRATIPHTRLLWMSAKQRDGVDELMSRLSTFVQKVKDSKLQQENNNQNN